MPRRIRQRFYRRIKPYVLLTPDDFRARQVRVGRTCLRAGQLFRASFGLFVGTPEGLFRTYTNVTRPAVVYNSVLPRSPIIVSRYYFPPSGDSRIPRSNFTRITIEPFSFVRRPITRLELDDNALDSFLSYL